MRAGRRWFVCVSVALLVAVLGTVVVSAAALAQADDDLAEQVRIVARKLSDGRIEFGLQQHRDGSWSERLLPARRFFPTAATVGRWLRSSPLTVGVAATPFVTPSDVEMRIVARRLADGKTEFGLQLRHHDTSWGERLEPPRRLFPADTDTGRWLVSTPLAANLPPRAAKNYELPPGSPGLVDLRVIGPDSCGLHADGAVRCWGSNSWTQCEPDEVGSCRIWESEDGVFEPAGIFMSIAAGSSFIGLRADGTATCWHADFGCYDHPPEGVFTAISAVSNTSCALRPDGAVTCWGGGADERDPPEGFFTAITGEVFSGCGIRTDGTVDCWGINRYGQGSPPRGTFTAVSSAGSHACGIRSDRTVACWGYVSFRPRYGTSDDSEIWVYSGDRTRSASAFEGYRRGSLVVPDGTFVSISTARRHACGIRTNGTATCWGINSHGQATAPAGAFTAIATSILASCGVRPDGSATCWGAGLVSPPAGSFTSISAGTTGYGGQPDHTCGLRTDRTAACWGLHPSDPPSGTFIAVTASLYHACGLRTNGTATCWGMNRYRQGNAPGGVFTTISTGETHTCGLRTNGTATCWGGNRQALRDAPSGVFTALQAGPFHTCGLRTDGTIDCWGYGYTTELSHGKGFITPPSGQYSSLSPGFATCALRGDGAAACWGRNEPFGEVLRPDGKYVSISDSSLHACGIRADGTVNCWTTHPYGNAAGQADAPAGTYLATTAGPTHTCGILEDHSLTCWGAVQGAHAIWHITMPY